MDEIDAALDFKNTTNLGRYISSKTNTQHIVVSLRKNMYEQARSVIGVYKVRDRSLCVGVDMEEM